MGRQYFSRNDATAQRKSFRYAAARCAFAPLREKSFQYRFAVAIVVISLLTSSVAGQKIPDAFRGVDATAQLDQTSIGDLKWFEIFKDNQLQKLVRTALVNNYDVRA